MPLDTSAEAARVQTEIHRRLGGPRRMEIAGQLSETNRKLARARVRSKHPECDETAIRDRLIRELHASGETIDEVVRRLINILDAAGVPYMLTGSFASSLHDRPCATQDIGKEKQTF